MPDRFSKRGLTILIQGLAAEGMLERARERRPPVPDAGAPVPPPEPAGAAVRLVRTALVRMHLP